MKIEIILDDNKKVNAHINDFIVKTDQPKEKGGDDTNPTPFDLFLASIGTCTGIYIKLFCEKRNISTNEIKVIQEIEENTDNHMVRKINLRITLPADFPEKYIEPLHNVIDMCKVKQHIFYPPEIEAIIEKK